MTAMAALAVSAEPLSRRLVDDDELILSPQPLRHGRQKPVRRNLDGTGETYEPNGSRECARRLRQMAKAASK